jgi:tight adherence protein C
MTAFIASFSFFLLLYAVAGALYGVRSSSQHSVQERFTQLADEIRQSQRNKSDRRRGAVSRAARWLIDRLPKPNPDTARVEKLSRTLVQAGYAGKRRVYDVHFISIALSIFGFFGVYTLCSVMQQPPGNTIPLALLGAAAGFLAPTYYLRYKASQRQRAIANQLSDALDLLVVSVEAGLGLSESIKVVGEEAERQNQEIGRELSLVSSEMSAGATMGEALHSLAERTAIEEMKPLASTLIQSEQLGSRIGPALKASSDALRDRRKMRAEEAAHKMTIKMIFPLGLLVLPAMIMLSAGPALIQVFRILGNH